MLLLGMSNNIYELVSIYALSACGISSHSLFTATLMSRVFGVFISLGWSVVSTTGSREAYLVTQYLMLFVIVLCAFMDEAWHYYVVMLLLGVTGTGNFSLSRSMLARLVPRGKATEVFGFKSFMNEVAGVVGPLAFSFSSALTGGPRSGFIFIFISQVLGILVIHSINFDDSEETGFDDPTTEKMKYREKCFNYGSVANSSDAPLSPDAPLWSPTSSLWSPTSAKRFLIYVHIDGEVKKGRVDSTATLSSLVKRMQLPDDCVLSLEEGGEALCDGMSVHSCGLEEGSHLYVI